MVTHDISVSEILRNDGGLEVYSAANCLHAANEILTLGLSSWLT
jgi:hypothetical protein